MTQFELTLQLSSQILDRVSSDDSWSATEQSAQCPVLCCTFGSGITTQLRIESTKGKAEI